MGKEQKKEGQLNVEFDETIAEGVYSNLSVINHSVCEFIIDFISAMPGTKSKLKSRIILTPEHAKRLSRNLIEDIKTFEKSNGEIDEPDQPSIPINFGPTGQA